FPAFYRGVNPNRRLGPFTRNHLSDGTSETILTFAQLIAGEVNIYISLRPGQILYRRNKTITSACYQSQTLCTGDVASFSYGQTFPTVGKKVSTGVLRSLCWRQEVFSKFLKFILERLQENSLADQDKVKSPRKSAFNVIPSWRVCPGTAL